MERSHLGSVAVPRMSRILQGQEKAHQADEDQALPLPQEHEKHYQYTFSGDDGEGRFFEAQFLLIFQGGGSGGWWWGVGASCCPNVS